MPPITRAVALLILAVALSLAQAPYATTFEPSDVAEEIPANRGAAALWQCLQKLQTRASLLMITAHPDDEDGGMLTLESRRRGTRVSLLTLNRGEGGANVMSSDFFDALGLVRTQELLLAGRYAGVEQYFTRVTDYGFSKTLDESLKHWTRERVLADVVRVIRTVRPLVITSVFVGGPTDGHGNHQTAGLMAREAFKAAADPAMFPEQIKAGLRPWQALKQYARTPWMGRGENQFSVNVEIPQGTYDPLLGVSYVQLAREGLGLQKSQNGGGSVPKPGPFTSTYHRFQSQIEAKDRESTFFDGIDTSLAGLAQLAPPANRPALAPLLARINTAVTTAASKFDAVKPHLTAPALADGLAATVNALGELEKLGLPDQAVYDLRRELEIKRVQFNNALIHALGLSLTTTIAPERETNPIRAMFMGDPDTFRIAIPGQEFAVQVRVTNRSQTPVSFLGARLEAPWASQAAVQNEATELTEAKPADLRIKVQVPENAAYTRPYFARPDIEQSYYDIADERLLTRPLPPYPVAVTASFRYQGAAITASQVVQTVRRVNGLGSVYEPLVIGPAISVAVSPRHGVVPFEAKSFPVTAVVHSNVKGPTKGSVRLDLPSGWRAEPPAAEFSTEQDGQDQTVRFNVIPSGLDEKPYRITAVADYKGKQYREGYHLAGYPGLRPGYLYSPSTYETTGVNVKVAPGLKAAYITGTGDDVPSALEHLGVKVAFLSAADIASADLSAFDTIVLGVRAYAARPELATYNNRLLEYVRNGGTLVVQYNTPEFDKNYGPYPYQMGNNPEEVTDEASAINILKPDHPVFQWPNSIAAKDFNGWVEERGSKWMRSWDPRYDALLETHDEGQEEQKGGLLYARYGKGVYVYAAYAFYRQLPAGVPGAYRIMANLLSLAKNPGR